MLFIIVGFNHVSMVMICLFNGLGWSFPSIFLWQIYRVKLYYIDILKLRTYELFYSFVHIISTKFAIVIDILRVI